MQLRVRKICVLPATLGVCYATPSLGSPGLYDNKQKGLNSVRVRRARQYVSILQCRHSKHFTILACA